jgi:hypothetical protein
MYHYIAIFEATTMDPLRHPDLIEISRRLRHQLSQVLEAEQEAAAVTLRRKSTVRDRLLDAEDRNEEIRLTSADGTDRRGRVVAVGVDHVVLEKAAVTSMVSIAHIVAVEAPVQ